jgi:hypothetical protein
MAWNPPPPGFDPLKADDATLESYHLPLRPDPRRSPMSYANWYRAMAEPLVFLQGDRQDIFSAADSEQSGAIQDDDVCQASSLNWSGAIARPIASDTVSAVEAIWTTRRARPVRTLVTDTQQDYLEYRASAWVGLDGYDPTSVTMPQIGTLHTVEARGTATSSSRLSVWWQWWHRDTGGYGPVEIRKFPVDDDDEVFAKIIAVDRRKSRFFLKNLKTGHALGFDVDLQSSPGYSMTG